MGRPKKQYNLSREEIIEMLKLDLEHEVNAMLDDLSKVKDGYEFEKIAVSGFSRFNNKWMQAMAGIEPVNKNLKKNS
jgi:predicted ArsR family transcriptional regulator